MLIRKAILWNLFRGLESLSMLLTHRLRRKSEPLTNEMVSNI